MKRYMILLLVTITTVFAIFTSGTIINAAVDVEYYQIKKTNEENIVTSSGKLQYMKEEKVKSSNYQLIDKILVSDGDLVEKGTPLYTAYEIENSEKLTYSFPETESLINYLSKADISEEIMNEIKKYAVKRTVKSPANGVVSSIAYLENTVINKNSVVMKIVDTKEKCIKININETYISQIKEKQKVRIKYSAVENKSYTGTVYSIAKEAKQTSGLTGKETTVEVVIKPDDTEDAELRIGYTAECTIVTSIDKGVLVLPYEYIYSDENGDYVYLDKNNKANKKYIRTGKEYKSGISVISGLKENDKIIVQTDSVYDGQNIRLKTGEKNA